MRSTRSGSPPESPTTAAAAVCSPSYRTTPPRCSTPEWIRADPTTDAALAVYFLFHDADLAALRHGLATLSATDLSGVYAEPPTEDPARLPSTYLLPRGDRTLRPDWMARAARDRLGVDPVELDGGHNLYTASPQLVADAIATELPRDGLTAS